TNPGTQAAPVATPQHAYDLVCPGVRGAANGAVCSGTLSTMCLKAGTYKLTTRVEFKKTRMGTSSRIITMMADPAATTKPILDFSGQPRLACGDDPADKNIYGVDIGADWYRVSGLEISGANDSGILVQGAHDFVENCAVHDSEDTGVLISSSSGYTGSGTYATITDVDSYHNHDERCDGANADGFGAKKGSGVGNVFDGCRSWDNSDDGYDFFAWTDPVTVKNSWAFNMGATTAGSQSNGNGFKMGGDSVSAKHVMSSLFAFYNNGNGGHKADWGFTNNSNPASMTCTGCGAWNNEGGSFQGITHTGDVTGKATAAAAAAAKRNADGSLPDITKL
ncbi:MAG TPA: right-handed parallel beta-helix repeat-containing protein, partial [Polyangia bacterium]|nr:right-handed parallel beta-helix repeat-containing protein [Polyangia bacterium]